MSEAHIQQAPRHQGAGWCERRAVSRTIQGESNLTFSAEQRGLTVLLHVCIQCTSEPAPQESPARRRFSRLPAGATGALAHAFPPALTEEPRPDAAAREQYPGFMPDALTEFDLAALDLPADDVAAVTDRAIEEEVLEDFNGVSKAFTAVACAPALAYLPLLHMLFASMVVLRNGLASALALALAVFAPYIPCRVSLSVLSGSTCALHVPRNTMQRPSASTREPSAAGSTAC